ncbi:hypothetical protein PV326_014434, partial [Microctonus aethiopoides]
MLRFQKYVESVDKWGNSIKIPFNIFSSNSTTITDDGERIDGRELGENVTNNGESVDECGLGENIRNDGELNDNDNDDGFDNEENDR